MLSSEHRDCLYNFETALLGRHPFRTHHAPSVTTTREIYSSCWHNRWASKTTLLLDTTVAALKDEANIVLAQCCSTSTGSRKRRKDRGLQVFANLLRSSVGSQEIAKVDMNHTGIKIEYCGNFYDNIA